MDVSEIQLVCYFLFGVGFGQITTILIYYIAKRRRENDHLRGNH